MKKRNIIYSLIFVFTLLSVMIYVVFFKEHNYYIELEARRANSFQYPNIENVSNNEFQNSFETAFKDQIVGRSVLLKVNNRINTFLNYISSRTHTPYTLYKIGDNVYTFDAAKDYLLSFPLYRGKAMDENVKIVADSINALQSKYSDINFYVYQAFRLNLVDWFDEDNFIKSYGKEYCKMFSDSLDNRIKYEFYYPKDLDEYKKYFFKTDPHWNTYGSYELGYKGIVNMINENYGDLKYLEPIGEHVYSDYDYYGQYARESLFVTSPDEFTDLKFNVPNYTTIVNGEEKKYDAVEEFESGEVEDYMMPYIYNYLHGNDEKEVIFNTDNENGRVLLSFVDSYSAPIKYLIASHFSKSIFIDLRLYPDFNIDEYIKKYNVTDILYLEFHGTLYDPSYIINID